MYDISKNTGPTFDPRQAVNYGLCIEMAYQMYDTAPNNPRPTPPALFIPGYKFAAWIQMKDFVIKDGDWTFYGFLAQSLTRATDFILVIRGTRNPTEWWDDVTSFVLTPMKGFGEVGYGFHRIYQTLRIVDPIQVPAEAGAQPLESVQTFAQQVAAAVDRHVTSAMHDSEISPQNLEAAAVPSIEVTAHSLGAALATLYVAENAKLKTHRTPIVCTFASPRVGNPEFATKFNELGVTSWRITNELDIVPKLPFIGFQHVETLYEYNSGLLVQWSLACWHALETYLHLLDPTQPLTKDCVAHKKTAPTLPLCALDFSAEPTKALSADTKEEALSVESDKGATINITIKIGCAD
jgi:hypothetical protein